ncbi:hypothetical protein [Brevibacillus sp. Leaf182]|uniref:hypothetical protein n=1 Tax=Brevibacillus sp. Leaf182 TaxID=1736290 RepID=UPI0006FAB6FC|nr:hypothetical protein [Brevibacillus sp. Leaf182]RAT99087.1 hypothetical protein ASG16_005225 [Brevibacillus sp. Leaf182]
MTPTVGDIYCVFVERLQKYAACQVTSVKESGTSKSNLISILELDWSSATLPDESELHQMKPLYCDYFFCNNVLEHSYVDSVVPKGYIKAGNIPPLVTEETRSYGSWDVGGSLYRQYKWNQIPQERRQLFKQAAKDDTVISLGGVNLRRSINVLHADILQNLTDISELEKLPCLTRIHAEEPTDSLLAFVQSNPFILELHLEKANGSSLDLTGSQLSKFSLQNADGLESLHLNDCLRELILDKAISSTLWIEAEQDGHWLTASFSDSLPLHRGLDHLGAFRLRNVTELDLQPLVQRYPSLRDIRLWGKPGTLSNLGSIKHLKELLTFTTYDLFGFSGDEFPSPDQCPKLSSLWMTSLPAEAAKTIKAAYKKEVKNGLDLSITKPRKPEWLAHNLTNPFRDWDGREHITTTNANKAANLYKKMNTAISALEKQSSEDTTNAEEIKTALRALVKEYTETFNKMDRRTGFIETVEREEIFVVLDELLHSAKRNLATAGVEVDVDELFAIFDQTRDF